MYINFIGILLFLSFAAFEVAGKIDLYKNYEYAIDELKEIAEQNSIDIDNLHFFQNKDTDYKSLNLYYFDYEQQESMYIKAYWYGDSQPTVEVDSVQIIYDESELGPGTQSEIPDIYYREFRFLYLLEFANLTLYLLGATIWFVNWRRFLNKDN